jgi:hypothetical protein
MAKHFEYMVVDRDGQRVESATEHMNWLDTQGEAGWELVQSHPYERNGFGTVLTVRYIFKRECVVI